MDGKGRNQNTTYVYSANNDFVRRMEDNENSNVQQFYGNTLVLYVDAPRHFREARMAGREDNMLVNKPKEAQYRLSDDGKDVKRNAHLIVNNFGEYENDTCNNIQKLIEGLFSTISLS